MADFNFYINRQGIQGRKGEKGDTGFSPTISVGTDTLDEYKLIIANESNSFETPNLRGNINIQDNGGTYLRYDAETQQISAQNIDAATADTLGGVRLSTEADVIAMGAETVVTPADVADALPLYLEGEGAVTITQDELTSKTKIKVDVPSVNDLESRMSTAEAEIADIQTDVANLNNNKVAKTDLATTNSAGIVKVDGTSITVTADGTISAVGGGGTGDVTASGNNVFTGDNKFKRDVIIDCNASSGNALILHDSLASPYDNYATLRMDVNGDLTIDSEDGGLTLDTYLSKSKIEMNKNGDIYFTSEKPLKHLNFQGSGTAVPLVTQENIKAGENITLNKNAETGDITISSTGGGSGSGDVTAAGNNRFTGDNTFTGKVNIAGGALTVDGVANLNQATAQYLNAVSITSSGEINATSIKANGLRSDDIQTTENKKYLTELDVDNQTIQVVDGKLHANSSYTLPTASTTQLGGVKVDGTSVTIDSNGVISAVGGGGGSAPDNMVTTDTNQDITGMKTIVNSDGLCFKSTNSLATSVTAQIVNTSSRASNTIGKVTILPDKSSGSRYGFARIAYGILNDNNSNYPLYGKGGLQVTPVVDDTSAEARILLGSSYNGMGNIVGTTSGLTIGTGAAGSELSITSTDITFNGQSLLNSGGETPSNMVTTDSDQTINGTKTFANGTGTVFTGTSSNSNSLIIDGDDKEIRFNSENQSDAVIKNQGWNSTNLNIGENFNSVKITTTLYDKNGNEITGGGSSAPENMVTTDTDQIITGAKTFTNSITFNNTLNMSTANTDTLYIHSSGSYAEGYTTDIESHKNLNIKTRLGGGAITLAPYSSGLNALKYKDSGSASGPSYDILHTGNLVTGNNITISEPNSTGVRTISGPSNEYMAGMAMPSDRYVNLDLGASGTSYTAPADGWVYVTKLATKINQYLSLTSGNMQVAQNAVANDSTISLLLQVRKGVSFRVGYNLGGATQRFGFQYAEGSQPTA